MKTEKRKKITPAAACKLGGIHVWSNAVRNAARVGKCTDALPTTLPRSGVLKIEGGAEAGPSAQPAAVKATAAHQQDKLVDILYQWTDEEDWCDLLGAVDPGSASLGTDMYQAVITKYQAETEHELQAQRLDLYSAQRSDENVVTYFRRISRARQRVIQAGRTVSMIDFIDTFKAGVKSVHKTWVSYIEPSEIGEDLNKLSKTIYRKANLIDGPTKNQNSSAFPADATDSPITLDFSAIIEEAIGKHMVAAFAASPHGGGRERGGGGGRPRGRGGRGDKGRDFSNYICHACGKLGHIASQCKSKDETNSNSEHQESAFPATGAFAFPAVAHPNPFNLLDQAEPKQYVDSKLRFYPDQAIRFASPPSIPSSSLLNQYVWDWISHEYIIPEDHPEILNPLVDKATGITYHSLTRPDPARHCESNLQSAFDGWLASNMAETYYQEADGSCCAFGEDYEHANEYEINYEQPAASPPEYDDIYEDHSPAPAPLEYEHSESADTLEIPTPVPYETEYVPNVLITREDSNLRPHAETHILDYKHALISAPGVKPHMPRVTHRAITQTVELNIESELNNTNDTVAYAFAPVTPDTPELTYNLDEALLQPGLPEKSRVRAGSRRKEAHRAGLRLISRLVGMTGINGRGRHANSHGPHCLKLSAFVYARTQLPRMRRTLQPAAATRQPHSETH